MGSRCWPRRPSSGCWRVGSLDRCTGRDCLLWPSPRRGRTKSRAIFGPHTRCSRCGHLGASVRPDWTTVPETCANISLAEGVGFEPTRERNPLPVFKTGALNHSATLPRHEIKHLEHAYSEHYVNALRVWTQLGPKGS